MGRRFAAIVVACATVPAPSLAAEPPLDPAIQAVWRALDGRRGDTIEAVLADLRCAPLDSAARTTVIATLPRDDTRPSRAQRQKIAMADRVLDYSARAGVISIRPISLDQAFVGLYFRTVVLASTLALDLLTGEEFAALVAHEIGHDYRWNDYWAALNARDTARMRALELWADAVAVLTLERIGIDPERLVSAVTKQTEHFRLQRAVADPDAVSQTSVDRYVPLDQRVAFIRAIAGIRWAAPPSTMTPR